MRRFVRPTSSSPMVERADIIDVNPTYANIRFPNGRETSVSLRDLAPYPSFSDFSQSEGDKEMVPPTNLSSGDLPISVRSERPGEESECVRRSARSNKGVPPDRLQLSF